MPYDLPKRYFSKRGYLLSKSTEKIYPNPIAMATSGDCSHLLTDRIHTIEKRKEISSLS